ncbi:MAG TPA: hypothetical protein VNA19_04145 [Pyrinomonadaceae bacterium]|nr:hypothetical protein [Pyrinomonadaceae bacterium]
MSEDRARTPQTMYGNGHIKALLPPPEIRPPPAAPHAPSAPA